MINKNNWKLTKKYLEYRLSVDQLCRGSYLKEEVYIRYLLEWAREKPFLKAPTFRPTLPEFLKNYRLDGTKQSLSPGYFKKILAPARRFFAWLIDDQPGYKSLKRSWVATVKAKRLGEIPKQRDSVTFEEILLISKAPVENLIEERTRASLVFLYLSGMRIGAFVTLPFKTVDIQMRMVLQYPNLGVGTKNGKYARTFLLPIPELIEVIKEWDEKIKKVLTPEGYWFAPLSPETKDIDPLAISIGEHRATLATKNIKAWLDKVGLKYHSPHKFRHGHIQYGLARSKSLADFKAISLNAMHSNTQITDQIYSNIPENEVQDRINTFMK
jgi:integrase